MMAKLTIEFGEDVLKALRQSRSITIHMAGSGRTVGVNGDETPREGSLPDRLLKWAAKRPKPFGNREIQRQFKLSRAHASMLLSRLATGPYPLERVRRGVYTHA